MLTDDCCVFQAIDKYRTWGPLLASICLLMWVVTIVNEIASCIRLTCAVMQLRGAATKIVEGKINSLSGARVASFVLVQIVRLIIAILLAYGGMRFLGNPVPLGDLILNTLALECTHVYLSQRTCATSVKLDS